MNNSMNNPIPKKKKEIIKKIIKQKGTVEVYQENQL